MHWLLETDRRLFLFIQSLGKSSVMDSIMLTLREATSWIPLYAFLLYYVIRYMRSSAWGFILISMACFALADFSSAGLIKPYVARLRPCYEPSLKGMVQVLTNCGGKFGFPSSHASNHFALAVFWYGAINRTRGRRWGWLFVWAFLIVYAQIYVGKHYPLDVFCGAGLGILVGQAGNRAFALWQNRLQHRVKV